MINIALDFKTIIFGFLAVVALPTFITFFALLFTNKSLDTSALTYVFLIACALWGLGLIFSWNNYIKYDNTLITIKAGFHSKQIKVLDRNELEIIELTTPAIEEYKIKYKTLGTSFPRYHMGNFVLKNGLKAFLLIIGDNKSRILIKYEDSYILTNIPLAKIHSVFNNKL